VESEVEESDEAQGEEQEPESDKEEEAEPPAVEEVKSIPIAALKDERQKRQSAEAELSKYRQKYEKDIDAPDPVDDPDGFKEHVRKTVIGEERTKRFDASRETALETYDDYEKMETTFKFLASQDETLVTNINANTDPSKYAYDTAKAYLQAQKDELRAEILGEAGVQPVKKEPTKAELRNKSAVAVPNLTNATAAGANSVPVVKMDDVDEMFGDSVF